MRIHNKKGSAIVEATMIFPLVITAVIAVLYIIVGLYLSLSLQSSLHIAIRNECGELSETVYRMEEYKEYAYQKDKLGLRQIILIDETQEYRIRGLFADKVVREEKGRGYVIDEAELIRMLCLAKEAFK
ncbi:MAG: hypothetical protein PHV71_07535 [Eubacteriales bacterium]|nr:hypothetical protein [Eubacteriales bacterium]MDD3199912.1 hypothetical protein [Eubacteriales bacterium]MDD4630421.1 hypothetical protein [Eubacteriales bacterium]